MGIVSAGYREYPSSSDSPASFASPRRCSGSSPASSVPDPSCVTIASLPLSILACSFLQFQFSSLLVSLASSWATRESSMSTKAIWNGAVIAATDAYEVVEGNVYFPPSAVNMQYVKPTNTHTTCGWKGLASYYTIEVDGKENKDAAWFYPSPKPAAQNIKDYVAFWKGVEIQKAAKA